MRSVSERFSKARSERKERQEEYQQAQPEVEQNESEKDAASSKTEIVEESVEQPASDEIGLDPQLDQEAVDSGSGEEEFDGSEQNAPRKNREDEDEEDEFYVP
ncbi:hypothetical protein BH10CYA1_BH10CYA1_62450 [soil metagenome]